jgi:hypothetical protein
MHFHLNNEPCPANGGLNSLSLGSSSHQFIEHNVSSRSEAIPSSDVFQPSLVVFGSTPRSFSSTSHSQNTTNPGVRQRPTMSSLLGCDLLLPKSLAMNAEGVTWNDLASHLVDRSSFWVSRSRFIEQVHRSQYRIEYHPTDQPSSLTETLSKTHRPSRLLVFNRGDLQLRHLCHHSIRTDVDGRTTVHKIPYKRPHKQYMFLTLVIPLS